MRYSLALASSAAAATALLIAACGGGGGSDAPGTMRLSLTDAPACGYDNVWVTVQKVAVHKSGSANPNDDGWSEVVLNPPQRIDLLEYTKGRTLPLGETQLPAGTYTQMRLVLGSDNTIKPTGGSETPLDTPSAQQSGLKLNVNMTVQPDTVADFVIDFDACKSFVKAGNSGKYLLKPVISVIPVVSSKIVGWVDPALANGNTAVSAQTGGVPLRSTMPDAVTGRFELFWIPAGDYDVVVTAPGRVNAVMTGVPVTAAGATTIGSESVRLSPPASAASATVAGTVTPSTEASVRAVQVLSDTTTKMEVGYAGANATTGAYAMTLPLGAPAFVAYAASASAFNFTSDTPRAGAYTLEARSGSGTKSTDLTLPSANPVNFTFP
jgi:hypothetical protein